MRLFICCCLAVCFFSCDSAEKIPQVDHIKIDLKLKRFEKDFFALDSNKLDVELDRLIASYPSFGENFMLKILNIYPEWGPDTATAYVYQFINAYRPVNDTVQKVFADFTLYEKELKESLQFLKHYFPQYKAPQQVITYVGPIDGYGDVIAEDAFMVGLHQHIGSSFSMYKQSWVQETYPEYITRRFEPSTISVNCMKNVVADMFPDKPGEASLIVQMVEKGKRLYILGKLLPYKEEDLLIGYSKKQLSECYDREAQIWDLFVQNNMLQTIDNNIIKNYIGESPKTQELGESSPGNIGSFAGWQIVKKYMGKQKQISLDSLMRTDAETLFREAKYKPG